MRCFLRRISGPTRVIEGARPQRWGAVVVGVLMAIAGSGVAASAPPVCADDVTYDVAGIQEARRRLKHPKRNENGRVNCAEKVLGSPELNLPAPGCAACDAEYVGLLRDASFFMHQAATRTASRSNVEPYLAKERAVRESLHEFLSTPDRAELWLRFGRENLEGLGDVYEGLARVSKSPEHFARRYVELMETQPNDAPISGRVGEIWARAVRSCDAWDFLSVSNRSDSQVATAVCSPGCDDEFSDLRTRAEALTPPQRRSIDRLLPALSVCSETRP